MSENLLRAYRGDDKYIFASYAHKDGAEVRSAIKALAAKGYRVWYDEGIEAGADWAEKIGTSLEKASLVLLFASKNSIKSANVLRELAFAKEHGIPVLTTFLGKVNLSKELERDLLVDQAANLASFKTYGAYVDDIAPALSKYGTGGEEPAADYTDEKIVFAKKQKGKKKALIAVLCLVILAAGAFAGYTAFFKEVPNVVGLTTEEAEEQMAASDFSYNVSLNYSDEYEYGVVFDQSAEGKALKFVPVVISQSLGPEENLTDVPDTVGKHVSDGAALLIKAGMTKFTIAPEISASEPAHVLAQSIPAGLRVSKANIITMDVATDGGDITLEIDGRQFVISGMEATTLDMEDEEALAEYEVIPESVRIAEAVEYLKAKYGTSLFDNVDDPATWGLLKQAIVELYGIEKVYVYAKHSGAPVERADHFLPWNFSDSAALKTGQAIYAAVKIHDPYTVSEWASVDKGSGVYEGIRAALNCAESMGIVDEAQDLNEPLGTVGELALLLADTDGAFGNGPYGMTDAERAIYESIHNNLFGSEHKGEPFVDANAVMHRNYAAHEAVYYIARSMTVTNEPDSADMYLEFTVPRGVTLTLEGNKWNTDLGITVMKGATLIINGTVNFQYIVNNGTVIVNGALVTPYHALDQWGLTWGTFGNGGKLVVNGTFAPYKFWRYAGGTVEGTVNADQTIDRTNETAPTFVLGPGHNGFSSKTNSVDYSNL